MERADFSSYRVLVVGGKTYAIHLLRSILGVLGVGQVVHVVETARAVDLLGMEHFNAVFYDQKAENYQEMSFPVAVRRKESMLNPVVPIIALQERARRRDVEQARDVGVTDVLTTPMSPRTVKIKLLATPRPFILAPEFFGPDRRVRSRAPWSGPERRKRAARKQKVDFVNV